MKFIKINNFIIKKLIFVLDIGILKILILKKNHDEKKHFISNFHDDCPS